MRTRSNNAHVSSQVQLSNCGNSIGAGLARMKPPIRVIRSSPRLADTSAQSVHLLGSPRPELVDPEQAVVPALSLLTEETLALGPPARSSAQLPIEAGARTNVAMPAMAKSIAALQRSGTQAQRPDWHDHLDPNPSAAHAHRAPVSIASTSRSTISPEMLEPLKTRARSVLRSGGQLTTTRSHVGHEHAQPVEHVRIAADQAYRRCSRVSISHAWGTLTGLPPVVDRQNVLRGFAADAANDRRCTIGTRQRRGRLRVSPKKLAQCRHA